MYRHAGLMFCSVFISTRLGLFGTNVKSYYNDKNVKYISATGSNVGVFTIESLWIDPVHTDGELQCFKKSSINLKPVQIFVNEQCVYTDPVIERFGGDDFSKKIEIKKRNIEYPNSHKIIR
jgi:hypothetical protein